MEERRTEPGKKGVTKDHALRTLRPVSPTYKMPDETTRSRVAILQDIQGALAAARCAAGVAGCGTDDFLVREVLLVLIQQIDQAATAVRRLA